MGAGINLFKTLFPSDYYPYTANSLMSAKPTGKKIYNKNLFNGTYDTIFQLPFVLKNGTTLTASCKDHDGYVSYIQYFDKNGTLIDYWALTQKTEGNERQYRTFTIQDDVYSVKFTNNSCEDMQLEYGSTATAYEPYSETTIVYSGNELRGLLKVGTDGLYADGDTDDGSGSADIRYNRLTLNSTTPDNTMVDSIYMSGTVLTVVLKEAYDHKHGDNYSLYNAICNLFIQDYFADLSSRSRAFAIQGNWSAIIFYEPTLTTLEDWNTYLTNNPVTVDYELLTPTTETSTAWSNPIVAKEGGTETFVDTRTIALPTGHDTIYGTDLSVNKAEFGTTVYGGSVDFTTGEVISNKNADGTDKTEEIISITPVPIMANFGANNLMSDTNGDTTVQYLDLRSNG